MSTPTRKSNSMSLSSSLTSLPDGFKPVAHKDVPKDRFTTGIGIPNATYYHDGKGNYVAAISTQSDPMLRSVYQMQNGQVNPFNPYDQVLYIPLRPNSNQSGPMWTTPSSSSANYRPVHFKADSKGNITGQQLGKSQAQLNLARQRRKDVTDTIEGIKYLRPSDMLLGANVGLNATMAGAASGAYDIGNLTNNFIIRPIASLTANVSDAVAGPTDTSAAIRNFPNAVSNEINAADTAAERYYDNRLKDITKGTVIEGYNDNYSRILGGSGIHLLAGAGNIPGFSGSAYKYGSNALQHAVMPGHKYIAGAMYRPLASHIARTRNLNPIMAGRTADQIYNNMMMADKIGRGMYMANEFVAKPGLKVLNGYTEGRNPYVQTAIQGSKAVDWASPALSPSVIFQKAINVASDRQGALGNTIGSPLGKYMSEPVQDFMVDMVRNGRISKEKADEIARKVSEWGKAYYENHEDDINNARQKIKDGLGDVPKDMGEAGRVIQESVKDELDDTIKNLPTDIESAKGKLDDISNRIPKTPEDARKIAIEAIKQGLMEIPEVRRAVAIYNGFDASNTTTDAGILKFIKQNAPGTNRNLLSAAGDSARGYFKDVPDKLEAAAQKRLEEYMASKGISFEDILNGKVSMQQVVSDVLSGQ